MKVYTEEPDEAEALKLLDKTHDNLTVVDCEVVDDTDSAEGEDK